MQIQLDDSSAHIEMLGDGPAVIMLHGSFMNTHMWRPQHALADSVKLIAVDLRGHGGTPCPVTSRSYNRPLDVIQIMDDLHIERAVFCGLSMGGPIAIQLALDYPHRCLGTVLLATGPGPADRPLQATPEMKDNAEREAQRLLELGPVNYFYSSPTAEAPGVKEFIAQPDYRAFFENILAANNPEYLANTMRLGAIDIPAAYERLLTTQRLKRMHEITTPMLFMVGSLDLPFSHVANFLKVTVPHCETEVIPGASHLINIDSADRVNERIHDFIGKVVE